MVDETNALKAKIALLEKEIQSLKDVSLFADIKPSIEEDVTKYKEVKISTVNLHYKVRYNKKGIVKELYERLSRDLYKPMSEFEIQNPVNGSIIKEEDLLEDYLVDGVIRLDFSYIQQHCDHHGHDDYDSEDFSDDENFYSSCSCAHHT